MRRLPARPDGTISSRLLLWVPAAAAVATFGRPFSEWSGQEVRWFLLADSRLAKYEALHQTLPWKGSAWCAPADAAKRAGKDALDEFIATVEELYHFNLIRAVPVAARLVEAYEYGERAKCPPHLNACGRPRRASPKFPCRACGPAQFLNCHSVSAWCLYRLRCAPSTVLMPWLDWFGCLLCTADDRVDTMALSCDACVSTPTL